MVILDPVRCDLSTLRVKTQWLIHAAALARGCFRLLDHHEAQRCSQRTSAVKKKKDLLIFMFDINSLDAVVCRRSSTDAKGILRDSDIPVVWEKYAPEHRNNFVVLLQKYGLLHRFKGRREVQPAVLVSIDAASYTRREKISCLAFCRISQTPIHC
jgi:hypothetical protein